MHRFEKWRDALQVAGDARSVIGVMEDYVDSLSPDVRAVIPLECQEGMRQRPLDIPAIAVCLLRTELTHGGSSEEWQLLHGVAHTFVLGATRLTLVHRDYVLVGERSCGGAPS
jgi:hypothetical protein